MDQQILSRRYSASADGGIVRVHRDTIPQADDIGVRIDMIEEKIMNGEIELLVSNYKNLMCGPNEDFNVSSGTNLQWLER
jgi:hypothetical protein